MRTPRQYLSERFPWLTLVDSLAAVFVLVLAIDVIWPSSRLVRDLVFVTAIPGSIGAIVWGLTFWPKARVQIGRLKLRYKSVRRIAGIAALSCLPFLLIQQASLYLRGPNILRLQPEPPELAQAYPKMGQWRIRVVVAIAHLEGDDGQKVESKLRDALSALDGRLHVTPVILNRTIKASGRPEGIAHLEAVDAVTNMRVESLIWGGLKGAAAPAVGPLYATRFGDYPQFGEAYLPGDFKLPELPTDDLCSVLRLMVATDSAKFMNGYKIKFGDALEPLIRQTRALADDPRRTAGWNADSRARVNLIIGIASMVSGVELKSLESLDTSVSYFQKIHEWTRDSDPLEYAIVQRNLGGAWCEEFNLKQDPATLHQAVTAYQNALAVYQSQPDPIDLAKVQLGLGGIFETIGRYEGLRENVSKAVDYYRAALKGLDPDKHPNSWGEAQLSLANSLRVLSFWDNGTKDLEDSIAADKAALKVYSKQNNPIHWADAQGQLAQSLTHLAQATSNADEFRESISILRQVLDGYPRDRKPKEWAQLEAALGTALVGLYDLDHESGRDGPEQAAIAYRSSLEELTLEHDPVAWAEAKAGLGNALEDLGYKNSDTSSLEQAVDAYNDSLKVYKADRQPLQWATVKYERGYALAEIGERGSGVRILQQALQDFREALAVLPQGTAPDLRNDIQKSIKIGLEELHQRGWTGS